MELTSLSNDKVKYWVKLHEKKFRDEEGLFLIEGDHLVNEALKRGLVKEIITLDDFNNEVPTYKVTKEIMQKISSQKSISKICAVCYKLKENIIGNKILCLDNIQDPGNLGTLIRSAAAFDFDTIVLSDDTVDLYNDKVIRSCEGMIFNVNVLRKNLKSFVTELKNNEYYIYSTEVRENHELKNVTKKDKIAIILGNEGNGVSKDIIDLCDDFIYIPMNEKCESLNVGVAGSIIMYEINR